MLQIVTHEIAYNKDITNYSITYELFSKTSTCSK